MKAIKFVSGAIAGFTACYLLGAFVEWSLNPGVWQDDSRWIVAIIGAFVSTVVGFESSGHGDAR